MANRYPISPRAALIEAREAKNISRGDVAAQLGITLHFATMVENGRQDASLILMQRWLERIGETSLDLFRRQTPSPTKAIRSVQAIKAAKLAKRRAFRAMKTAVA